MTGYRTVSGGNRIVLTFQHCKILHFSEKTCKFCQPFWKFLSFFEFYQPQMSSNPLYGLIIVYCAVSSSNISVLTFQHCKFLHFFEKKTCKFFQAFWKFLSFFEFCQPQMSSNPLYVLIIVYCAVSSGNRSVLTLQHCEFLHVLNKNLQFFSRFLKFCRFSSFFNPRCQATHSKVWWQVTAQFLVVIE